MTEPLPDDAVLMTLAGIAYGAPSSIGRYLGEAAPTAGWTLAWLADPADPPVNFAYIARDGGTGACVLAIRGTYPNPFSPAYWQDGAQDSPFGDMADWPRAPGAAIWAGTAQGLANLVALRNAEGVTLAAAVAALPPEAALTVTGHSLGGTLAPVLALHLAEAEPDRCLGAVSFAGMTPGNQPFADLFGPGSRLEGRLRRVYNTLDTVAYGWDRVLATRDFYQPAPQGGLAVEALLVATAARLALGGYGYAPVGPAVPLPGVLLREPVIPCDLVAYVFETLHQHMPDTYLALLGAPPLPFSIVFGSAVVPRDHPAATGSPTPRPAPVHLDGIAR
ncbi:MAG: lipase [Methylobacterium sp.]|uniref:lipase family protein n=1 Tax=Methylobacterium sp. TaxID=409 RepID=UPI00258A4842|nr:lipase [Methylobacterium sp.]MBY0298571.1 lipase [Methylobacterium sp.]